MLSATWQHSNFTWYKYTPPTVTMCLSTPWPLKKCHSAGSPEVTWQNVTNWSVSGNKIQLFSTLRLLRTGVFLHMTGADYWGDRGVSVFLTMLIRTAFYIKCIGLYMIMITYAEAYAMYSIVKCTSYTVTHKWSKLPLMDLHAKNPWSDASLSASAPVVTITGSNGVLLHENVSPELMRCKL